MGETRKRMKESGGGGGGGGFVNHSRTLPRTNFPHLHHRSRSHSHTFPHHYHAHPYPHPHPHIREVPFLTSVNVGPPAAHPIDFDDDDDHHHDPNPNHDLDHDRLRHHHHVHGLFGSETDTDDGKVTSATHTPSPHHLLNDSNETQTEEDDETTLREILHCSSRTPQQTPHNELASCDLCGSGHESALRPSRNLRVDAVFSIRSCTPSLQSPSTLSAVLPLWLNRFDIFKTPQYED
ncbi:hypothetical protein V9T40_005149 [Parthenolecanium corni]|uniref:Uncharacterized protein n=1 Tax=Parthenolecanium corni TaxID=536013 RepID=A0AAN9TFB1_9HEMI